MRTRVAITNERALAAWQQKRDAAASEVEWREAGQPCARPGLRWMFAAAEEGSTRATDEAKLICAEHCPVRELCLDRALRDELGYRGTARAGVLGGMTGPERAVEARRRGCGVCGAELDMKRRALFCSDHARKGARQAALAVLAGGAA